jgi:hypothetical protein
MSKDSYPANEIEESNLDEEKQELKDANACIANLP